MEKNMSAPKYLIGLPYKVDRVFILNRDSSVKGDKFEERSDKGRWVSVGSEEV